MNQFANEPTILFANIFQAKNTYKEIIPFVAFFPIHQFLLLIKRLHAAAALSMTLHLIDVKSFFCQATAELVQPSAPPITEHLFSNVANAGGSGHLLYLLGVAF